MYSNKKPAFFLTPVRVFQLALAAAAAVIVICARPSSVALAQQPSPRKQIGLPSSKLILEPVPGAPRRTNSFPATVALHPDGRYLAILNNGYGTEESHFQQSIAVLDLATNQLRDFPDHRFPVDGRQTYFLGLAFSTDGARLYVSVGSFTDPAGERSGDLGNGIAVYSFQDGVVTPQGFLKIPLQSVPQGKEQNPALPSLPPGKCIPYPAGLAVVRGDQDDEILVADNLSDNALLMDAASGRILHEFDLTTSDHIPASYPYAIVATRDGVHAYCSLWNASEVVELDLRTGQGVRRIPLLAPNSPLAAGSHPTALLLSKDEKQLYVALANADAVAVIDPARGQLIGLLSTLLPGQDYGGSYPSALAEAADGKRLLVVNSGSDAVAVFDTSSSNLLIPHPALGFIPTEWYPTAVAVHGDDLFIASGKGVGSGPNAWLAKGWSADERRWMHPYIVPLLHGSIARLSLHRSESELASLTEEVQQSNLMQKREFQIPFVGGHDRIKHVIYIVKENRSYDQILGDLKVGDADPSLVLYGEDITPNEHAIARQFGVVDNFYCSGNVSGDGHVWSTAATSSDYTERTWQVMQRADERTYDYEGDVDHDYPLLEGIPDADEPATGYIWTNVARHELTHRNYAEYIETQWCDTGFQVKDAKENHPLPPGASCPKSFIKPGELLPENVGTPHGSPSPYPWPIPIMFRDVPTKPEIVGHFDPRFPDFRIDYPDQLRADEFLDEFKDFVEARKTGHGTELPQFVLLRLPNDHTAGTDPGFATPSALVADNDLAVGRVVDAVSHSPYWDDTAILILEDDAQNGPDHVDAHRSIAFVVSKYSPSSEGHPFVDHTFYTTVSMIHTIEALLGLPPMNNNDAHAPVMAPLFSGSGQHAPFEADYGNQRNGLIYKMNTSSSPGAAESSRMDFSHADAADAKALNTILWRDRKGLVPMPESGYHYQSPE
ncbi:MAG: bifunctional YncE family protein/alkaline phosphatase family protein [Terriglobia bacterium]